MSSGSFSEWPGRLLKNMDTCPSYEPHSCFVCGTSTRTVCRTCRTYFCSMECASNISASHSEMHRCNKHHNATESVYSVDRATIERMARNECHMCTMEVLACLIACAGVGEYGDSGDAAGGIAGDPSMSFQVVSNIISDSCEAIVRSGLTKDTITTLIDGPVNQREASIVVCQVLCHAASKNPSSVLHVKLSNAIGGSQVVAKASECIQLTLGNYTRASAAIEKTSNFLRGASDMCFWIVSRIFSIAQGELSLREDFLRCAMRAACNTGSPSLMEKVFTDKSFGMPTMGLLKEAVERALWSPRNGDRLLFAMAKDRNTAALMLPAIYIFLNLRNISSTSGHVLDYESQGRAMRIIAFLDHTSNFPERTWADALFFNAEKCKSDRDDTMVDLLMLAAYTGDGEALTALANPPYNITSLRELYKPSAVVEALVSTMSAHGLSCALKAEIVTHKDIEEHDIRRMISLENDAELDFSLPAFERLQAKANLGVPLGLSSALIGNQFTGTKVNVDVMRARSAAMLRRLYEHMPLDTFADEIRTFGYESVRMIISVLARTDSIYSKALGSILEMIIRAPRNGESGDPILMFRAKYLPLIISSATMNCQCLDLLQVFSERYSRLFDHDSEIDMESVARSDREAAFRAALKSPFAERALRQLAVPPFSIDKAVSREFDASELCFEWHESDDDLVAVLNVLANDPYNMAEAIKRTSSMSKRIASMRGFPKAAETIASMAKM